MLLSIQEGLRGTGKNSGQTRGPGEAAIHSSKEERGLKYSRVSIRPKAGTFLSR
jgi:hypothetical protein